MQIGKRRIGPFRIYPTIQLREIGYDDNVYYKREEDNPISDYTATISPQINVFLLFQKWVIFSFSENPEYVYYVNEKRERAFNNSYSSSIKLLIFRKFVLSGGYRHQKSRRRATSEFDVRADEKIRTIYSSFFYETARETSFGFSGMIRKISYEDIVIPEEEIYISRDLNREEVNGNFEFYYKLFSNSYFFINGGYTEYNFEHIRSKSRDSYSYQIYSGIRFPLLGRIRGTLALGYRRFMPKKEGKKGFSGLFGDTNLDLRIRRFGFRIHYNRDCRFSYWMDSIFFLENRYGMGISFYLTRFLRFDYDFIYGTGNYPEFATIRLPDESYEELIRNDVYRINAGSVVLRIIRNTGIGVRVFYWERESNIPGIGRNRWFVGGYVTYEF